MPVDAKLQAILDAGKALGKKPVEQQTPAEARAERAEMVAGFVPMPEYAGVRVEDRAIPVVDSAGRREIGVRVYRPAAGDGQWPVVVFFQGVLRFPQCKNVVFAGDCVHFCGGNVVIKRAFSGAEKFPYL